LGVPLILLVEILHDHLLPQPVLVLCHSRSSRSVQLEHRPLHLRLALYQLANPGQYCSHHMHPHTPQKAATRVAMISGLKWLFGRALLNASCDFDQHITSRVVGATAHRGGMGKLILKRPARNRGLRNGSLQWLVGNIRFDHSSWFSAKGKKYPRQEIIRRSGALSCLSRQEVLQFSGPPSRLKLPPSNEGDGSNSHQSPTDRPSFAGFIGD
jgi:hypothetical protein